MRYVTFYMVVLKYKCVDAVFVFATLTLDFLSCFHSNVTHVFVDYLQRRNSRLYI